MCPAGQLGLQLGAAADGDQPAVVHDGDPFAELFRLLQVVGGEKNGHLAGNGADVIPDGPP